MRSLSAPLLLCLALSAVPAVAHDWYDGWTNPISGLSCCNLTDCRVITCERVKPVAGGYELEGRTFSRRETLASPDGRCHACFWGGQWQCLAMPTQGF